VIPENSFAVLTVTINSVDFSDDDIAPSSQFYCGKLSFTYHLDQLKTPTLDIGGTLIDVSLFSYFDLAVTKGI
jgi:hypothetical protein